LRKHAILIFFLGIAAVMVLSHLPLLRMPFHWDELGQFVPTALDLYRDGAVVTHSALPNVHPPGVAAILAISWKIFGFSIASARLTMLMIGAAGVLFTFLAAIHLGRGSVGTPAFAAIAFLLAAPLFYTQSMMVLLDMPAMTFTMLALLLFLDGRYAWCAAVCAALVLMKETAITTPMVFAAWLWFRDKRRVESLYFLAPAVVLGAWLLELHHVTGYWTGNADFAKYNVNEAMSFDHILASAGRRLYFLFVSDGNFIGSVALMVGWRELRGKPWTIAFLVAGAQLLCVTVLGGAILDRYVVPVMPIVYIAMAVAASAYPPRWRVMTQGAMVALLLTGWFWNPPYPFPYENNLTVTDFVALQKEAAQYLEAVAPNARIASAWPFYDEVTHPENGYVSKPMKIVRMPGFLLPEVASVPRSEYDYLVVFSRSWSIDGTLFGLPPFRWIFDRYANWIPQASDDELRRGAGLVRIVELRRHGLWVKIYAPERQE
jgi:4-amino-4-deoxy-L-arabinose transferase-like glycosyltransferase